MRKTLFLLATCAVLSACGGDSGNTSISTPTPTPSPTPTPTPTQTALTTGEVKPALDATFISATMELDTTGGASETNGIITGGSTSNRVVTFDTPGFSANYNSGYRLADAVNSASFGAAQLSLDTTVPRGNGTVLFTNISGGAENYLALYQQTTSTSGVKGSFSTTAQYGGTAGWQHTVVSGSSRHTRLDYFGYGTATPVSAMPHSGVVKYSILGSGNYATDADLWFLFSLNGVQLTVDYGAGTVSGTISVGGQNFFKSVTGGVGSLPINGTISGNASTGAYTGANVGPIADVAGRYRILFVGPTANEIVITFVGSDGSQALVGAAVGVIDPNFN